MKIEKRLIIRIVLIFLLVIGVVELANLYGELLWFRTLNYAPVFWTVWLTKGLLGILFGCLFILIAGLNVYLSRKLGPPKTNWELSYRTEGLNTVKFISIEPGKVNRFLILACIVLGIAMGLWPAILKWDAFLRYWRQIPFLLTDPIFLKDIGFFVFSYPIHLFLQSWLLCVLLIIIPMVGFIYIKDKALNLARGTYMFTRRAKIHLSVLAGFLLMVIAWNRRLKTLALVYSQRGVAFGAGYTDMNAQWVAYWIMIIIASICALMFWINSSKKGWKWPLIGLAVLFVIKILVSELCPWAVQKFILEPSELTKEMPYILHNIRYTRLGYNLDQIEEKDFQASTNLTFEDIKKNFLTIKNVKLWDKNPLRQTYRELQEMRLYYNFVGVDEDRYTLNGEKTQIMLSVRELDQGNLPLQAQTFENQYFKYTHGYGLCMSPVNSMTEKGLPNLVIKDIPPVSQTTLHITRPEIYYGEKTNGFVIVNSKSQEFDYPKGDINVYSRHEGKGGVPIGSLFKRLVFSIKYFEPRILFTSYTTPQSRIMLHRHIRDRVKTLAPFLTYDHDPYAVASETGRIFWIQDAYTTTDKYPYSERYILTSDSDSSGQTAQALFGGQQARKKVINYIRNSVKAVIDTYTGETTFYVIDESDPIIQTYRKIFPSLFKSFSEMPEDLRAHIRYPRDLFEIQAKMYRTYHMKDPQVFYNKEDLWDLPMQKSLSGRTRFLMKGYYIIMRLPEQTKEEFLLMVPFTPDNKSNTIAWMCAQCDGPDYGRLLVYKFPKEKLVYGPRQVEARIDQQTKISRELTLWGQQGSSVLRGDLLVIPIEESLLYIEPVYLVATDKSSLPELKRVIVVYGEKVEMKKTLIGALEKIFDIQDTGISSFSLGTEMDHSDTDEESVTDLARRVTQYFQAAQGSIQKGDWIDYGRYQELLEEAIQDLSMALELEE
jgi:uncharacterized membrane protein (UPF0182 family)